MPSTKTTKGAVLTLALSLLWGGSRLGASAQTPQPMSGQVQMILFKIVKVNGKKFAETPTGETIPIEGHHLAKDASAVAVYRDQQNNFWFINKDGQPTSIAPDKVQAAMATVQQQRAMKQATAQGAYPFPTPSQQTTIINNGSSGTSSGAAMMGTGLAAAGGAMAGSMIGAAINDNNHWYGVPYGSPMYRGADNKPYYVNNSGNKTYVNNAHVNSLNNQWGQQGQWQNRDQWNHPPTTTTGGQSLGQSAESQGARQQRRSNRQGGGGGRDGWGGFRRR